MKDITVGSVIVAAGLSSRMNDYKPLMKLGSTAMIETTVNNFVFLADEIVVVTGYRGNDIKKKLSGKNVNFVNNNNYENTHMFDSICLGLRKIEKQVDLVFVTPADSPFVKQITLKNMIEAVIETNCKLLQPSFEGKGGHPLLLNSKFIKEVLKYSGINGMKGLIANMSNGYRNIPFDDGGIVLDADTEEEFKRLLEYRAKRGYE